MKEYLISAVFVIIFIAFAEMLTVNGKNGKAVKIVLSLVAVVSFISPILNIFNGGMTFEETGSDAEYVNYLIELEKNTLEKEILTLLNVNGYSPESVEVDTQNVNGEISTKKVILILSCQGINCETTHINIIKEVRTLLLERVFGAENEVQIAVNFNEIQS